MNGPAPAGLEGPSVQLDSRLAERYRRLQLWIALPLLILILGLAAGQYRGQRGSVQRDLARDLAGHVIALDSIVSSAFDHVAQMRVWAEGALANPPGHDSPWRAQMTPRKDGGRVDGYTLDAAGRQGQTASGQLLWLDGDPRLQGPRAGQVEHALAFFEMVKLTHAINPHFQWSYFFPAERDFFSIYPWVSSNDLVEGMGHADMDRAVRSWFSYEVFLAGTPERNSGRRSYWTAPYVDSAGAGAMVSHGAPVYVKDRFRGIVGTDLKLVTLSSFLKGLPRAVGRLLIVDQHGALLADSDSPLTDRLRSASEVLPPGLQLADLQRASAAPGVPLEVDGYSVVARPASDAPWYLVSIVSEAEILRTLLPRFTPYAVIVVALGLAFWASMFLLRREFIHPALLLLQHVQRLSFDPQAPEPPLPSLWQTWSAMLRRTFTGYRQAEQVRSAIVSNAPIAVVTVDAEGKVVEFNPAAEATFGYSREVMLGQDSAALLPPLTTAGERGEQRLRRASGEEFPAELAVAQIQVGSATLYTAFIIDLSERQRAEDELARQREAARQAEKLTAMGALLAGVAHELNNPLAILVGRATLLQDKTSDPVLQQDAARIRAAAERCGRIVSMFLGMARQRSVELRPVQLNDVVRSAVELFGYTLRSSGIELELALAPDLPQIEADGDQLGQVVLNLVVNAQQSLAAWGGPRKLRMETGWERASGEVCLRVRDSGPGVPADLHQRIFDPFFTTKAEGCGTGMGLAVSRTIVQNHQGRLELESVPGGASFVMTLPARPAADLPPETRGAEPAAGGDEVLLVDDETELAAIMAETLERAGFQPHVVGDGEAALAWLAGHRPAAIVSDVRMPGMDGPAFWRSLGERHPALRERMIFVTGDTLSPGVASFLRGTGCPCLEKPFTPGQLLELVRQLRQGS